MEQTFDPATPAPAQRATREQFLSTDDKDMLEDLIVAAFNDAVRRVEATVAEKFSGMASGLSLPPGMKLPF